MDMKGCEKEEGSIARVVACFDHLFCLLGRKCTAFLIFINSYPANWSEEKVKKEPKKRCKYFHGVADLHSYGS